MSTGCELYPTPALGALAVDHRVRIAECRPSSREPLPVVGGKKRLAMSKRIAVLIAVGLLAAVACDEPMSVIDPVNDPIVAEAKPITIHPDRCPPFGLESDPVKIKKIGLSGDLLTISVEYSGGCEEHFITLNAGNCFLESYPVQSDVFMVHEDPADPCDSVVSEERVFDLTALKEAYWDGYRGRAGPVILNIYEPGTWDAYQPEPRYEFGPR